MNTFGVRRFCGYSFGVIAKLDYFHRVKGQNRKFWGLLKFQIFFLDMPDILGAKQ